MTQDERMRMIQLLTERLHQKGDIDRLLRSQDESLDLNNKPGRPGSSDWNRKTIDQGHWTGTSWVEQDKRVFAVVGS